MTLTSPMIMKTPVYDWQHNSSKTTILRIWLTSYSVAYMPGFSDKMSQADNSEYYKKWTEKTSQSNSVIYSCFAGNKIDFVIFNETPCMFYWIIVSHFFACFRKADCIGIPIPISSKVNIIIIQGSQEMQIVLFLNVL